MRRLLGGLVIGATVACGEGSLAPLPLEIAIEASRATAAPGDSINFLVNAQGGTLVGIETTYGDGTLDLYATGGARTARVTFRHAYTARGNYTVEATVTDATAGTRSTTVQVQVN